MAAAALNRRIEVYGTHNAGGHALRQVFNRDVEGQPVYLHLVTGHFEGLLDAAQVAHHGFQPLVDQLAEQEHIDGEADPSLEHDRQAWHRSAIGRVSEDYAAQELLELDQHLDDVLLHLGDEPLDDAKNAPRSSSGLKRCPDDKARLWVRLFRYSKCLYKSQAYWTAAVARARQDTFAWVRTIDPNVRLEDIVVIVLQRMVWRTLRTCGTSAATLRSPSLAGPRIFLVFVGRIRSWR